MNVITEDIWEGNAVCEWRYYKWWGHEDKKELERRLKIWREKLEGAGPKLSRSKTKHLPP